MVQHAQADHQQQQQQQEEDAASEEKSLLRLPNDVWEHIMTTTDPKNICRVGCSSQTLSRLANRKRRGVLLARHWGRLQLHVVRQSMQARGDFVSKLCSRQGLDSREASQAHILDTLQVRRLCWWPALEAAPACKMSHSSSRFHCLQLIVHTTMMEVLRDQLCGF